MIEKAREFAIAKHGDQKYGSRPYSYHLDQVVSLLEPYGELAQVIGYLHDVVEDTGTSTEEVEREFGSTVAACVAVLTDEPGTTRKERKEKTYQKMARTHFINNGQANFQAKRSLKWQAGNFLPMNNGRCWHR